MTELGDIALAAAAAPAAHLRDQALDAARGILGPDRVLLPRAGSATALGPNTSMFRSRRVRAVIRPSTAEAAARVVAAFGSRPGSGPLHPISTGRNWGLGSSEPAQDDAVVLDLGDLAAVRDLDLSGGWAVIEPGVTQGRLAELLRGTGRMLNVTVSAAATSVIGNMLDRGVGLRRQRVDDLLGLEVVLPDGETVRVGWWPDPAKPTAPYPHGLGPSLLPLFVQSNLGVVTAAAIRLLPRPEALRVLRLGFAPERLGEAAAALRRWVHQGLVRGVPRVFDPLAGRAYGGGEDEFLVHLCVDGTAESVEAQLSILAAEAERSALFSRVDATEALDPQHPNHETAVLVERGYAGDPDVSDRLFEAKMGRPADQVDTEVGFVFFLPLIPFTAEAIVQALALVRQISAESGVPCSSTQHILGPDVVDLVVAMRFQRDPATAERAHRALDLLYERFSAAGFAPYRLDVEHAGLLEACGMDPAAAALSRRLKDVIDPHGAIAPGRYC